MWFLIFNKVINLLTINYKVRLIMDHIQPYVQPLSMRPFFNFIYNVRSNEEVDDEKLPSHSTHRASP